MVNIIQLRGVVNNGKSESILRASTFDDRCCVMRTSGGGGRANKGRKAVIHPAPFVAG
jgi:hypothetical protein